MKRIVTLSLAAALMACGDLSGPNPAPVVVSVRVANLVISRGTPVPVTVTVRNVSSTVQYLNSICVRDFRVRDIHGIDFPMQGPVCVALPVALPVIAPGDSLELPDAWDGSIWDPTGLGVYAPPGDYYVAGRVRLTGTTSMEVLSGAVRVRLK